MTPLCEFCGAYTPRNCELRDEMNGICPWEISESDPDILLEDIDERLALSRSQKPASDGEGGK
jgi:hypothetical protein